MRINLWKDPNQITPAIVEVLPFVDVLKLSEEELHLLTGLKNAEAIQVIKSTYNIPLIVVTLGSQGAMYVYNGQVKEVAGIDVKVVDTTGAGDCFVGALLAAILEEGVPIHELAEQAIELAVTKANVVAALSTTKKGAIPSIPSIEQINEFNEK